MKLVLQTVLDASVTIDGKLISEIGRGFLILAGFTEGDNEAAVTKMAEKSVSLRVFSDSDGKTNLSLDDIDGAILSVSQFTLYANCKKGRRPSFTEAMEPAKAKELYLFFCKELRRLSNRTVLEGVFGADMKVSSTNDGPFTIILDDKDLLA